MGAKVVKSNQIRKEIVFIYVKIYIFVLFYVVKFGRIKKYAYLCTV